MGNLASENSVWLKEYVKRVSGAKAKSDKSKGPIILIVIPLLLAAGIGFAIYNGGLNDPQTLNTIKILSDTKHDQDIKLHCRRNSCPWYNPYRSRQKEERHHQDRDESQRTFEKC